MQDLTERTHEMERDLSERWRVGTEQIRAVKTILETSEWPEEDNRILYLYSQAAIAEEAVLDIVYSRLRVFLNGWLEAYWVELQRDPESVRRERLEKTVLESHKLLSEVTPALWDARCVASILKERKAFHDIGRQVRGQK